MGIMVATRALVAERQHAVSRTAQSGLDSRQPAIGQS